MTVNDQSLSGRRALVTGGASGIGAACVRRLAEAGAEVSVVDVDEVGAKAVAAANGGIAVPLDLLDASADLEGAAAGMHIIVNNAGFQHVSAIEDFPLERFQAILRIMVEAPFRLIKGALPQMYRGGWGRVVNVSSVHGLRASPFKSAYVSGKHALEGLSKVVALEGGPHGVTSNCVNPAYVRTPLVEKQILDQAKIHGIAPEQVVEKIMLTEPAIKRLIEPEEVAEAVAYLCTPAASFINGTSIVLDGGWTAR
ncbi:MAG: 3-hydroxybutyrate dehydrogenase [Acidimicrobiia bacterium]|nr:3-hydroxybutyrate dehydrogenase [Acidimicrobiia bacterium]